MTNAQGHHWLFTTRAAERASWIVSGLSDRGHQVAVAPDLEAALRGAPGDVLATVDTVAGEDRLCTAARIRQVELMAPGTPAVVLHDERDTTTAAVVMRHGGQPFRSTRRPAVGSAGDQADEAVDELCDLVQGQASIGAAELTFLALTDAIEGRYPQALAQVARVGRTAAPVVAAGALADTTALLLERLKERSHYSISSSLVISRLGAGADIDIDACHDMLQWAGLRSLALEFDLGRLVERHGATGVLFGSFHSAHAVVRFAAERSWRTPKSMLDEVWDRRVASL